MSVGENIKRIRRKRGLTQKKLGELCNPKISESTIRKYELDILNPKIETVDKIAAALGVSIVSIMERFTIEQYKTTSEYQKLEKTVNAEQGIIAILNDIYGNIEDKKIEGKYESGHYYLVGDGENQFVLYDHDIDTLYESTKASIPFLVNRMKDSRPEGEIIEDYLRELDSTNSQDEVSD